MVDINNLEIKIKEMVIVEKSICKSEDYTSIIKRVCKRMCPSSAGNRFYNNIKRKIEEHFKKEGLI